jgi:4-amino-4-deoxy-L-arabinose transferase-like glycosyltransferase
MLLLVLVVTIPLIGIPAIGGSSEAREGQVIAVMTDQQEFVLPLRNGVIPSKPPLFHWMGYGVAAITGAVDEFSVRLPSLLAGIALLAVLTFVMKEVENAERAPSGTATPELALGILVISYGYFHMMHQAMVDMVYALTVWITIWAGIGVFDPEIDSRARSVRRSLFWLSCGAAAVARGPLGALLPVLLTAAAGFSMRGHIGVVWQLVRPSLGWVIFAAVALPWYLLAIDRGGMAFVDRQLLFENLSRVTGGEFVNEEPWYYYGPSLLRTTFPWSALLLSLIVWRGSRGQRWSRSLRVPLSIMLVGLLCISASSGKRHSYLLPLYPAVAWACAAFTGEWLRSLSDAGRRRLRTFVGGVWVTLLVLSGISLVLLAAASGLRFMLKPTLWEIQSWVGSHALRPLFILALFGAYGGLIHRRANGDIRTTVFSCWVVSLSLLSSWHCVASGVKGHLKNFQPIANAVRGKLPPGSMLSVLKHERDEFFDPFFFYFRDSVQLLDDSLNVDPPCVGYSLVKASWFDGGGEAALIRGKNDVTEIARYRNLVDGKEGRADREMVLFLCRSAQSEAGAPWT